MGSRFSRFFKPKAPSADFMRSDIGSPRPLKSAEGKAAHAATDHLPGPRSHDDKTHPPQTEDELEPAPPYAYQDALSPVAQGSTSSGGDQLAIPTPHSTPSASVGKQRSLRLGSFTGRSESSDRDAATPDATAQTPTAAGSDGAKSSRRRRKDSETRAYLLKPLRQESYEDALRILKRYNTVIVVDDSGSMDYKGRWGEARQALAKLADVAKDYDQDGIDIVFLNHEEKDSYNMTDANQVNRVFDSIRPDGPTPLGEKLDRLLGEYLRELESNGVRQTKPVNYIIITDGMPSDTVDDVIIRAARRLDKGNYPLTQVGLQFVQIGDGEDATAFLRSLDDDLANTNQGGDIRDIVDTTPYLGGPLSADTIIKILLGGINRRVDQQGSKKAARRW